MNPRIGKIGPGFAGVAAAQAPSGFSVDLGFRVRGFVRRRHIIQTNAHDARTAKQCEHMRSENSPEVRLKSTSENGATTSLMLLGWILRIFEFDFFAYFAFHHGAGVLKGLGIIISRVYRIRILP